MKESSEIGRRLELFGKTKFGDEHGWKTAFAKALGIALPALNRYLLGSLTPGIKMHKRLRSIDCDIEWLMTGQSLTDQTNRIAEAIAFYDVAKEKGIESAAELKETLERGELAERTLAPEVLATLAAARKSSQAKYQKMRKRK